MIDLFYRTFLSLACIVFTTTVCEAQSRKPAALRREALERAVQSLHGIACQATEKEGRLDLVILSGAAPGGLPNETTTREALKRLLLYAPEVRTLRLLAFPVSDEGWTCIRNLKELESLEVVGSGFGDSDMRRVSEFARLRSLTIRAAAHGSEPRLTSLGLPDLRRLTNLQSLELPASSLGDGDFRVFSEMTSLRSMTISGESRNLNPAAFNLDGLAGLPDFERLELHCDQATDATMESLKRLKNLRSFSLTNSHVTGAGLAVLARMPSMTSLRLACPEISDPDLGFLDQINHLESLSLINARITDAGTKHLAHLKKLRELSLQHVVAPMPVTDKGLAPLNDLQELRVLKLRIARVSHEGITIISCLQKLEILEIDGSEIVDEDLPLMAELKNLKELRVRSDRLSGKTIAALKELPRLTRMDVMDCPRFNDEGLDSLALFPALKEINVRNTAVTDAAVARLKAKRDLVIRR